MAGLGRKEWSPGDTLNAADVNGYLMDQSVMVFAGTAARASAIPTPSAGMVAYSTATSLQVYNGSAWVDLGVGYGVATGGSSSSITVSGVNYSLLSFTSDSNLVVTKAGLFDILLVGGAGGAGSANDFVTTGGGGGGAVIGLDSTGKILTTYLAAGTVAVDVGAGGAAQTVGNASYLTGVVAAPRGGYGIGYNGNYFDPDGNGGTFHTLSYRITNRSSFFDIAYGQYAGGQGLGNPAQGAGGGGGSASAGGNGTTTAGGSGGNGLDISPFIGGSTYYAGAGGGGGGSSTGGAAGNGGVAGKTSGTGNAGVNYGAGGGGSYGASSTGGAGAAGAVFVRFKV
jgi:hypothetical protein